MFGRKRKPSDFSAEIEAHLELEVERLRDAGMSEEKARIAARRAFGNVTRAQERFYEAGRWVWWDQLWRDVRFGLRMMTRSPSVTTVAVLITRSRRGNCGHHEKSRSGCLTQTDSHSVAQAFGGIGRSWRIIQDVPNLSLSMAKRNAKDVSSMGMKVWPSSESRA